MSGVMLVLVLFNLALTTSIALVGSQPRALVLAPVGELAAHIIRRFTGAMMYV